MIYPWLQPALDQWHQQLAANRQPQALIIEGNQGIGKSAMTRAIVAELLCRAPKPEPCGECQSCRIYGSGQHPDLILVAPEKNLIKVAVIRELVRFFTATAHSAPHKVAVIRQADGMNTAAANALLKVLEEPPAGSLLILETDRAHYLLPTIRSRCLQLKLQCRAEQYPAVKNWLQKQKPDLSADQLAQLWALSPGLPLQIARLIDEDVVSQLASHMSSMLAYLDDRQSLTVVSQQLDQEVKANHWPLLQTLFLHWLKEEHRPQSEAFQWSHDLRQWFFKQPCGSGLLLNFCQLMNTIMVNLNNQTKTRLLIESMLVKVKQRQVS
ncbi:hypothetical protein GCM10011365_09160 [Marinicella pacifica]|uniref:DNA-directed DNA polymerase n=1 Tax=Marinicella pacifica TaxID=1171543 RepID=A0A917FK98_9GAMM|nr:DNA polymerase III subunit delta' [Marinicella pacifica]GGF90165.1 hypothetical protein GCM10011365_09160 [Marinicella pacifica]